MRFARHTKGRGKGKPHPIRPRRRHGYRVGEVAEANAINVLDFEIDELGNEHIITEAAKALHVEPTKEDVQQAIKERFGPDAQAIWLCSTRKRAEHMYGPGVADKIRIPRGAVVISDLGADGRLYVYRNQRLKWWS